MNIKATTRIYGIFGHPVSHSLSPSMHNCAFQTLGLDCIYIAFDIIPEDLESATKGLKALSISGINVTIPHKKRIIEFMDNISEDSRLTGAINTVKNDNGVLTGYNTDVGGFIRAINEDLGINPRGLNILMLGAGGAARAVLLALCMNGSLSITIINRSFNNAEQLASEFSDNFVKTEIKAIPLTDESEIKQSLKFTDLFVNASSMGMNNSDVINISLENLPRDSVVYDLVYKPRETELLRKASQLGLRASGGLSMLLYQGGRKL